MFDDVVGEEKIFKVEINSAVDRDDSGCFKIVNVFSGDLKPTTTDDCINYATREDYKTQVVCDNSIQSETIEDIITDLISPNRCYSDAENGSYCKVIPLKLISSLLHKKVVFMVDARPMGYEMNRSVYIVQQILDDAPVINVFEAAAEMNEHKIHVLVDSMLEVEDAFSQCESDHEAMEDLHAFYFTIDALQKISPWKEGWSIEAKILTIWEDANILKEGDVFIISDFKVIPNDGLVRVTRHRFCILFKCSTSVVAAASRVIPNPSLSLTSMDEILQKRTDYEYLIDFVRVLCGLKRKMDVECNGKILKVIILEVFVDGKKIPCNLVGDCSALIDINSLKKYRIASHHFSRLCSNEIEDLVSDGQFFVVGKIKEIVEDPEWWVFSCVCRHPIVGDDNVFHCQLCNREVQHFMIRIKILVEDGTSCGMFVLLDSAATKLLGRTCSDVFLLLEDEMDHVTSDSAFSPIFEDFSPYGQLGNDDNQVISGVPIQDQIYFLIGEIIDVLKHKKWWYYCCLCNATVCHVGNVFYCYLYRVECIDAIRRYHIKIVVFHSNGCNIFILQDDESTDDYTVPNSMISQLMNKKIVFIVDPRPVGYELNTSLHIVCAIYDDIDIVKFLEDSTHDNQQQTVNHDFHARISSSQGSNLFGNHQPLTIREEFRSAFGQCENTVEDVERMDECSS
ncbi:hypothetical protein Ahy_A03g014982 [Arachis hypogaea]|uniref:Uncharacterized protein n=1 Tax=Arachis hypogaea TaxID=3818 RepID=A0A445DZB4_ARAHY|nr:hypothetical protein Ahy_A03g014982 [Arachis hypogaea]